MCTSVYTTSAYYAKGAKVNILLFGGSFDPPHKGHQNMLKLACAALAPQKVIVMPVYAPPHKALTVAPPALRLAMCKACFGTLPNVEISDFEINKNSSSYTIDTVDAIYGQYPKANVYLLIGSDMLQSFTTWRNFEMLLETTTLVAFSRQKNDALAAQAEKLRALGGEVMLLSGEAVEVSSTQIRAAAATGADISAFVPAEVEEIVKKYNLYR